MADDPPPADFEVSRANSTGTGIANVYACRAHLAHTKQVLMDNPGLAGPVVVGPGLPGSGCKGHLEDWPVS